MIRRKQRKIDIGAKPISRYNIGSTPVDEVKIGDTFTYDGVESVVTGIRETACCYFFMTAAGYERKFKKTSFVDVY